MFMLAYFVVNKTSSDEHDITNGAYLFVLQ